MYITYILILGPMVGFLLGMQLLRLDKFTKLEKNIISEEYPAVIAYTLFWFVPIFVWLFMIIISLFTYYIYRPLDKLEVFDYIDDRVIDIKRGMCKCFNKFTNEW